MFTPIKLAAISVAAIALMVIGNSVVGHSAHAESNNVSTSDMMVSPSQKEFLTLEVTPVCADKSSSLAYWKVVNKNDFSDVISWKNLDNGVSGSFVAQPGTTTMQLATSYKDGANNQTEFKWTNNVSSTNSSNTPCDPPAPVDPPVLCIDGHTQQNLNITWLANNKVSISTKDGLPLCDDVQVFFSSYTMPANYNGQGFYGNTTAYPQPLFFSTSVTLNKGFSGTEELEIKLPDSCNNVQVDVYYAPEIKLVLSDGHGTQNIESKIYLSTGTCDDGQGNGGGETPTTPTVPTTPPVVTPPVTEGPLGNGAVGGSQENSLTMPTELPTTGAGHNLMTVMLPLLLAMFTYASLYFLLPNKQR